MRRLWTESDVVFEGRWDRVAGGGIDPLPARPIPIWIGASGEPALRIRRRIGRQADGWFVLCSPERYEPIKADIDDAAAAAGRDPGVIGAEAGVALVGARQAEWRDRVAGWHAMGLSHLCLRTLGGALDADGHMAVACQALKEMPPVN